MNPLLTTFTAASSKTLGHNRTSGPSGPTSRLIDFFLVGGGAGGGELPGGGGGGVLLRTGVTVITGDTHTITIGTGGSALLVVGGPGSPYRGGFGGNTAISISTSPGGFSDTGITGNIALGGAGGGQFGGALPAPYNSKYGGCGGGINSTANQGGGAPNTGVGLQGYNGGYGTANDNDNRAGGGGGGGGANGGNCRHAPYNSGDGGAGYSLAWAPAQQGVVGSGGYFSGGGGGGGDDFGATLGAGGQGGGGVGGGGGPNTPPGNGGANTGGGGGGTGVRRVQQYSGSGGTGCAIIRVPGSYTAQATTGSPDRRESGGYTYYTWTGDGSIKF